MKKPLTLLVLGFCLAGCAETDDVKPSDGKSAYQFGGKMVHLMHYLGTQNYQAIYDDPRVKAALERQVGSDLVRLKRYLLARDSIGFAGSYLVLNGTWPTARQDRRGIIVVNIEDGEVIAGIYDHGMRTLYTREANPPVVVPITVWNWVYRDEVRWVPPKENFELIER